MLVAVVVAAEKVGWKEQKKRCCKCLDFMGRMREMRAGGRSCPSGEHPSCQGKILGNELLSKTSWEREGSGTMELHPFICLLQFNFFFFYFMNMTVENRVKWCVGNQQLLKKNEINVSILLSE